MRLLCLLFFLTLFSCTSPPIFCKQSGVNPIQNEVSKIVQSSGLKANIGIKIRSLSSGKTLFSLNSERLLTPASNLKILTAASALHYLGPGYHFQTQVLKNRNNLILKGGAAPYLSLLHLDSLAHIVSKNIKQIDTLFLDATCIDLIQYGHGWMWDVSV